MEKCSPRRLGMGFLAIALLAVELPANAKTLAGDAVCPNATPYAQQYQDQAADGNTPVDDFAATIAKAIDAYDACASRMVVSGSVEGRHYAEMRQAQFRVAQGRLFRLLERYDEARTSLQSAFALLKDSIEWRSPGRNPSDSRYKEPSLLIKQAAQAELDLLPKPGATATTAPK